MLNCSSNFGDGHFHVYQVVNTSLNFPSACTYMSKIKMCKTKFHVSIYVP